jgi:hypothetical protein
MQCPACGAQLKQRERSGYTCSKCKHPFALDPKLNPLRLHDLRLRALDRKLSDSGRLHYTAAQLLHAAAAPVVAAQKPAGVLPIGCMVIIAGVAFFLGMAILERALFGVLAAGSAIVILGLLRWSAANRPFYRTLPIDQPAFVRDILGRWRMVYGGLPPALLLPEQPLLEQPLPREHVHGALVCADADLRACLAANGAPARYGLALLPARPPFTAAQQDQLTRLRTLPAAPILLLHDASPAGCLLVTNLREQLGLATDQPLIDLGLTPNDVAPHQLVIGAPPDAAQIARLRAAGERTEAELNWLAAGNIAPLAGVTPKRLLALIERGMQRAARMPEVQAQQVGFMSWP